MSSQDFGTRPSITTRPPATANLMIDSADRNENIFATPFDFQIQKNQALLNGFFTRIATSEVALEWAVPNINTNLGTDTVVFDCSQSTYTVTLQNSFYTVEELLRALPQRMNQVVGTANGAINQFSTSYVGASPNPILANNAPKAFTFSTTALIDKIMDPSVQTTNGSIKSFLPSIDLRPTRYIDFVSEDLTYNQNLKDNSTAEFPRDVLNRWYFDWDSAPELDGFGYPILMGQSQFAARRIYNPPKFIRWEPTQPVGNTRFQLYDDQGQLMTYLNNTAPLSNGVQATNWLMTLQVSEN